MQTQRNTLLADLRPKFPKEVHDLRRVESHGTVMMSLNAVSQQRGLFSRPDLEKISTSRGRSDNLRKTSVLNESNVVHLTQ